MVIKMIYIGSHVSYKNDTQLVGSVKEALSYGSNAFMFYTGAPQNTQRGTINDGLTLEAMNIMKENNIELNSQSSSGILNNQSDLPTIKLNKEKLLDLLRCPLCKGFYRTPYTINECMHTFCRSCIFKYFCSSIVCALKINLSVSNVLLPKFFILILPF